MNGRKLSQTIDGAVNSRLSRSLNDLTEFMRILDSGPLRTDISDPLVNTSSPGKKPSVPYLLAQDCPLLSNLEAGFEPPLSDGAVVARPNANHALKSNKEKLALGAGDLSKDLVIIDLNSDSAASDHLSPGLVKRCGSMQWFQNTVQNVTNKYRDLFETRRPSEVAESRTRHQGEGMDDPEYEALTFEHHQVAAPPPGPRRFSEDLVGKQQHRRFPFTSKFGHLRGLWKERFPAHRRQEDRDHDQNRPDVCPLFIFPKKGDEDEIILDALRQAMRKCTAPAPSARPTSATVFDQLSRLLD